MAKIRFVVLTKTKEHGTDFEVSGSWLQCDEDVLSNVIAQAIESTADGDVEFFTLDTETLVVERVDMEVTGG